MPHDVVPAATTLSVLVARPVPWITAVPDKLISPTLKVPAGRIAVLPTITARLAESYREAVREKPEGIFGTQ